MSRIRCANCEIMIDGDFTLPALLKLSPPQLDFVEVFIKNRGVIREVERELGVSYPTVRARLDDVIAALGFQVRQAAEQDVHEAEAGEEKRAILEDVKAGRITAEQALLALRQKRRPEN